MTGQEFLGKVLSAFEFSSVYFVIQLGRSVLVSYLIVILVLLMRKTVFRKTVFLKGMLWFLFLLPPFVGKMKFFYESRIGTRLFIWWHNLCCDSPYMCELYILGMLVFGSYIFYQRRKLKRFVSGLMKDRIGDRDIYICERPITPFTIGLFRTKIVVPRVMLTDFKEEELKVILLHEKVHARLGHLWCYFIWDMLRILLWANPLLTVCMKYLREDLEAICDRVAIQRSKGTSYDYGRLLLKSMRILGNEPTDALVAFAGEQEYRDMKMRIRQVAYFKPYKRWQPVVGLISVILIIAGLFYGIRQVSYPVYMERMDIIVCDMNFQMWQIGNLVNLQDAISIDKQHVYINCNSWNAILQEQGIEEDSYYIYFGGYMKLPGIGGGGNAVFIDAKKEGERLIIPYHNNDIEVINRIVKML